MNSDLLKASVKLVTGGNPYESEQQVALSCELRPSTMAECASQKPSLTKDVSDLLINTLGFPNELLDRVFSRRLFTTRRLITFLVGKSGQHAPDVTVCIGAFFDKTKDKFSVEESTWEFEEHIGALHGVSTYLSHTLLKSLDENETLWDKFDIEDLKPHLARHQHNHRNVFLSGWHIFLQKFHPDLLNGGQNSPTVGSGHLTGTLTTGATSVVSPSITQTKQDTPRQPSSPKQIVTLAVDSKLAELLLHTLRCPKVILKRAIDLQLTTVERLVGFLVGRRGQHEPDTSVYIGAFFKTSDRHTLQPPTWEHEKSIAALYALAVHLKEDIFPTQPVWESLSSALDTSCLPAVLAKHNHGHRDRFVSGWNTFLTTCDPDLFRDGPGTSTGTQRDTTTDSCEFNFIFEPPALHRRAAVTPPPTRCHRDAPEPAQTPCEST